MPYYRRIWCHYGELKIDDLLFLTMGGDLPSILQVVLCVPLAAANGGASLANSTLA